MKTYKAEPLLYGKYRLGESPFYDARTGIRSFVDILEGKLYLMDDGGGLKEVPFRQQSECYRDRGRCSQSVSS